MIYTFGFRGEGVKEQIKMIFRNTVRGEKAELGLNYLMMIIIIIAVVIGIVIIMSTIRTSM